MYLSSSQVLSHSRWSLDCITIFQSPRKTRIICVTLKFLLALTEYDWGLKMWAGAGECRQACGERNCIHQQNPRPSGENVWHFIWKDLQVQKYYWGIRYLKYQTNSLLSYFFARSSKLKVIVAAVSKFSQSFNFFQILTDLTIIISPNGEKLDRNMKTLNFRSVVRSSWSITRVHASVRVNSQRSTACPTRYDHVYRVSLLTRVMTGLVWGHVPVRLRQDWQRCQALLRSRRQQAVEWRDLLLCLQGKQTCGFRDRSQTYSFTDDVSSRHGAGPRHVHVWRGRVSVRGVASLLGHGDSDGLAPGQGGDLRGAGGHRPGDAHHPGHAVPHGHQEETLHRPQIPLEVTS